MKDLLAKGWEINCDSLKFLQLLECFNADMPSVGAKYLAIHIRDIPEFAFHHAASKT
jgi:hypothetical protein